MRTQKLSFLLIFLILTHTNNVQATPTSSFSDTAVTWINRYPALTVSLCAMCAIGLSYFGYKLFKNTTSPAQPINPKPTDKPKVITKAVQKDDPLWITTNDDQLMHLDIQKYPSNSLLHILLETYNIKFGQYNSAKAPLKLSRSKAEIILLEQALACIDSDMSNFDTQFTQEQQEILLEMSAMFRMPQLTTLLITNQIKNNDINTHIMSALLNVAKESQSTIFEKIMNRAVIHNDNAKNFPYTDNKDRYEIVSNCSYLTPYAYNIWDRKNKLMVFELENGKSFFKKFSYNHKFTIFPRKPLLLCTHQVANGPGCTFTPYIYDIDNNTSHSLGINQIKIGNIAISPDGKYVAICSEYLPNTQQAYAIYLCDISDINNIKEYRLAHQKVYRLAFSPDSTMLVSGSCDDNGTVQLWNIANLTDKTAETIQPRTLLSAVWCWKLIFNKDNNHLAIVHAMDIKIHTLTILTIDNSNAPITFSYQSNCADPLIFKNNSDFIVYTSDSDDTDCTIGICNKNGKGIYPSNLGTNPYTTLKCHISNNQEQIAISHGRSYKQLFTINSEKVTSHNQIDIDGHCKAIDDDGSFWIQTRTALKWYNHQQECIMTLDCKKEIEKVIFSEDKQRIACHHSRWNGETQWELPSKPHISTIKNSVNNMTPLQYMLIKKACDTSRKKNELMIVKPNSLDTHTLQSFGKNKELMITTLRIIEGAIK